jgi:exopolysaccharide biosynthesis polyprenyl glycosylphosphotransferase
MTRATSSAATVGVGSATAPEPAVLAPVAARGALRHVLEGRGWLLLRPALDFLLTSLAIVVAFGGVAATAATDSANAPVLLMPFLVVIYAALRGSYRQSLRALVLDSVVPVLGAVSVAAGMVAVLGKLINGVEPTEHVWLHAWAYAVLAVGAGRFALYAAQRWARARRLVGKPVLILGAGLVGAQLARRLIAGPEYGLVPVGFLDDDPPSVAEVGGRDVPVLGTIDDVDLAVERTRATNLIVAFSTVADARVSRLVQRCQELGVEVSVVPRMYETINHRVGYDSIGGVPLLSFSAIDPRGVQFAVKHALDFALAGLMLLVLSPLMIVSALLVRLSSPGPILFRQARVGRDGKLFYLYKFRSMRPADPDEAQFAPTELVPAGSAPGGVEGVDRRTRIGRILRATSIDELPQLFNVLRGDMSLVGPRPERPEFVELFREDITRYGDRHRVKSGITGWAQVHGLRGKSSIADRVEWDNYYIAHWSLGLDLKILLLTLRSVFQNAE